MNMVSFIGKPEKQGIRMERAADAIRNHQTLWKFIRADRFVRKQFSKLSDSELRTTTVSEILARACDTPQLRREYDVFFETKFNDFTSYAKDKKKLESQYIDRIHHWIYDFLLFADDMNGRPERSRTEELCEEVLLKVASYVILLRQELFHVNRWDSEDVTTDSMRSGAEWTFDILSRITEEKWKASEFEPHTLPFFLFPEKGESIAEDVDFLSDELYRMLMILTPLIFEDKITFNRAKFQALYDVHNHWKSFLLS